MDTPQVEEIVALATNSFDAWAEKMQDDGVDLNQRVDLLLPLLIKLTNPEFIRVVEKVTTKSQMLEQAIDAGEELPLIVSTGVNTLDAWAMSLTEQGVDINQRIDTLIPLLIKMTDPKFLKVAEKLTTKSDLLDKALDAGDELPKLLATGMNTLDGLASRLQEKDVDIDQRLDNVLRIAEILTSCKMVRFLNFFDHHMERFLLLGQKFTDADQLNAKFAAFLEDATTSLAETTSKPTKPIKGIFSMLGVMKDENVSRALGFTVELARSFGRNIRHRN